MPLHPKFLSARRQEVHDQIAALYSRHVTFVVRERILREAVQELDRLDAIEGYVRGMQELAAADPLEWARQRFAPGDPENVVRFPGEGRRV